MTGKQYAFGMLGGFVGVFIDIGIGFLGGFPWFALIGVIVGLILGSNESNSSGGTVLSKEEKERINLENFMKTYKDVYIKLPKDSLEKLGSVTKLTMSVLGLSPQDMPQELLKMGGAIATILKENKFGTITPSQKSKVNKLISDFEQDLGTLAPILNKSMNAAMDKGLDFGIIGGAADVALYSVMDTHERRKNFRTANRATNQMIDGKVIALTNAIKTAIL